MEEDQIRSIDRKALISQLSPATVAQRLQEIDLSTIKEIVQEARGFLASTKLDQEGSLQIWKGILKSIWINDKPSIKESLAEQLSSLIFSVREGKNFEGVSTWITSCFSLMKKEEKKVDLLKDNEFASFLKKVIIQFIRYLRKKNFNLGYVRKFHQIIQKELYSEITPSISGLPLFLMQIFPEVLIEFENVTHDQIVLLLELFSKQLNSNASKQLRQAIKEQVFKKIVTIKQKGDKQLENFNMKTYRDKLFHIAQKEQSYNSCLTQSIIILFKRKTEETTSQEFKAIVKMIDDNLDLEKEQSRYEKYAEEAEYQKQERRQVWEEKDTNKKNKKVENQDKDKDQEKEKPIINQSKQKQGDKILKSALKQSSNLNQSEEGEKQVSKKVKLNEDKTTQKYVNKVEIDAEQAKDLSKKQQKALKKQLRKLNMIEQATINQINNSENQAEDQEQNQEETQKNDEKLPLTKNQVKQVKKVEVNLKESQSVDTSKKNDNSKSIQNDKKQVSQQTEEKAFVENVQNGHTEASKPNVRTTHKSSLKSQISFLTPLQKVKYFKKHINQKRANRK